jgi:uncharacterized protein YecE (DUF72 family)
LYRLRFRAKNPAVDYWIGTSGFSYPEWRGSFYPEKFPAKKMLDFYAQRLRTVELNNTFYRMPKPELLRGWAEGTPAGFLFAPKASQQITHRQKLSGSAESTEYLFRALTALGEKLGPVLFQLPPFLRKDLPRLADFLALIPRGTRVAFEFRHASWFDDAVYQALAEHEVALCIADSEELATPLVATTRWGYLRLRRMDYDDAAVALWAGRLRPQLPPTDPKASVATGFARWDSAFIYFKHEEAGRGPVLAAKLTSILASTPASAMELVTGLPAPPAEPRASVAAPRPRHEGEDEDEDEDEDRGP